MEFDLLCKIVRIVGKDEWNMELLLKDTSDEVAFLQLSKTKYSHLKEDDIIRIRRASFK